MSYYFSTLRHLVETVGVEPTVPKRRIYSPLGLPIFLHLQIYKNTLNKISQHIRLQGENVFVYGTRYENRTRLSALKGQRPNR